jgi:hypothetical protein
MGISLAHISARIENGLQNGSIESLQSVFIVQPGMFGITLHNELIDSTTKESGNLKSIQSASVGSFEQSKAKADEKSNIHMGKQ